MSASRSLEAQELGTIPGRPDAPRRGADPVQGALWAADALRGIAPHLGVNERHLVTLGAEVERLRLELAAAHATERLLTLRPSAHLQDALAGIRWFNTLSRAGRAHWLGVAGSAVPADAWEAFKRQAATAAEGSL